MKQHLNYWLALALLLPALNACQDDDTLPGKTDNEGKTTRVSASIGDKPDTRAQVQYGTQDPKDGEIFMWNTDDKFDAYNISTASGSLTAKTFTIAEEYNEATPSKTADFACEGFSSNKGETILALYGNYMGSPKVQNGDKKGIKIMTTNVPPAQEKKTASSGNADLKHLQWSIYMYAMTTAGENGRLPSLSFRHLSALCRVSLTNSGAEAIEVSEIRLDFGKEDNIVGLAGDLTVWEDGTWTYEDSDPINCIVMNLTSVTLAASETYDIFIPFMPLPNSTASAATIKLKFKGGTEKSVSIAGFNNVEIEAGMRYWFDLTVKADGTLAQTGTLWDGASPTSAEEAKAWLGAETSGAGDPDAANHVFTITTARQLAAMSYLVNNDVTFDSPSSLKYAAATYRLGADIDLKDYKWTPIGTSYANYFKGTFDGQGYHISNLKVDNASGAGLFGDVAGGTVKNLRVSGDVKTTGDYAGGIVGRLHGTGVVENCIFSGKVSGKSYVGGIAGWNSGKKIAGCYAAGSVTATGDDAGGIAGQNSRSIENCYSGAKVKADSYAGGIAGENSGGTVTHCYATGNVSGSQRVGGIVGYNSNSTVKECIALNSGLTRTKDIDSRFGRVVGENIDDPTSSGRTTDCGAFSGMTLPDGVTATSAANGIHGIDLTAAECLTATTYTGRSFPAAPATPGWAFDSGVWTYLPWNPAFESFPGIAVADYRIVPSHLTSGSPSN